MTVATITENARKIRGMTFAEWMKAVDKALVRKCGLTSDDLSDVCYADWYESGRTPTVAANKAVRENGGDF